MVHFCSHPDMEGVVVRFCVYLAVAIRANEAYGKLSEHDNKDQLHQFLLQAGAILKDSKNASKELSGYIQNSQLREITASCRVPCKNGGQCIGEDSCLCTNGWFGLDCSQFECASPCIHGTCSAPETCLCAIGWKGKQCESPICNPECSNGGLCTRPNTCACAEGYTGSACKVGMEALCVPVCVHGFCISKNTCECIPGWMGRACDIPICEPACLHHGKCIQPGTCECTDAWKGTHCQLPVCLKECLNGGQCVAPDQCSCPTGHSGSQCQFGSSTSQPGNTCSLWSSRHLRTFDGHIIDFPGRCRYTMVSECKRHSFAIELIKDVTSLVDAKPKLRNHFRGRNNQTKDILALVVSLPGIEPLTLLSGHVVASGEEILDNQILSARGLTVYPLGRYIKVETKQGISLLWNGHNLVEIKIEKNEIRGSLCGLCGDADGDPLDDMALPDGSQTSSPLWFARGWRLTGISQSCEEASSELNECSRISADVVATIRTVCQIFIPKNVAFSQCISAGVDANAMVESCVSDLCNCEVNFREDCQCTSVAQFSRTCISQTGIVPSWRKSDFCDIRCPEGMIYSECGSSCPKTCHTQVTPNLGCIERCVDGCVCPEGTVLHRGACIKEYECPCLHNGIEYPPQHALRQECSTCVCNGAMWNCTNERCEGECTTVGDPHYKTFDDHMFTMPGECQYIFAKDCSSDNLFSVVVDNSVCGTDSKVTCTKDVTISLKIPMYTGSEPGSNSVRDRVLVRLSQDKFVSVNGERIEPPFVRQQFQIFKVSSDFVQFRSDVGITVDWDGKTRVYVKAERRWRGKLCGLCGDYDGNQGNDMLNINGLVERNAVSFGNTWKASSDCNDMSMTQQMDPCQINQQRASFADTECGVIRGEVFRDCHQDIDPQPYYEMCRYDVCGCEDGESCLCNVIAHYARLCAKRNHVIEWRADNFCSVSCEGGQVYQECGSSCNATCRSITDQSVHCTEACVQGCNCPPGRYLNDYGACVKKSHCECHHNGQTFRPFESLHRASSTCHCMDGRLTCVTINDELRAHSNGLRRYRSTICPRNQLYKTCNRNLTSPVGVECRRTCRNMGEECFSNACVEGCDCPDNLVYDEDRRICVEEADCPCYFSGRVYLPGHKLMQDCNECFCENHEWICTNNPCIGTCLAYGDSHYKTFDGYTYNFMGGCSYILTQDYCGHGKGSFRIHIENKLCSTGSVACSKVVTITLEDKVAITMEHQGSGYDTRDLVKWGIAPGSKTNSTRALWEFHEVGRFIILSTNMGLTVQWDRGTTLIVKLDPQFMGRVCGLCGNFDDNQNNDAIKSDRISAVTPWEFGNSWKTSTICENVPAWRNPCDSHPNRRAWAQRSCNILFSQKFQSCHDEVDVTWYHQNCISDACSCNSGGDCECLCTAVAAYARACSEAGVEVGWRTASVCPLMCESYNKNDDECTWRYNECESACPNTCRHRYLVTNHDDTCSIPIACVEGCFPNCPDGTIYDEESKECVRNCPPGCYANGKRYNISEVVVDDECHECICADEGRVECVTLAKCAPLITPAPSTTATATPGGSTPFPEGATSPGYPLSSQTPRFEHVLDVTKVRRFCDGKVNLAFLVHSSDVLAPEDFQDVKRIVFTYVSAVAPKDYGQNSSLLRLGIYQFGDKFSAELDLLQNQNMSLVVEAVENMELQRSRSSDLAEALDQTLSRLNETDQLMSEGRNNSGNIVFVLLFSKPSNNISTVIHSLEKQNIKSIILSFWLAEENEKQLHNSDDARSQLHHLSTLQDIFNPTNDLAMNILEEICSGVTRPFVPTSTAAEETTTPHFIVPPTPTPTGDKCTMSSDLVILVDVDLFVSDNEVTTRRKQRNVMTFLESLLEGITISRTRTKVAILLVDRRVWRVIKFSSSKYDILDELSYSIRRTLNDSLVSGVEYLDLSFALDDVTRQYFNAEYSGSRRGNPSVHRSVLVLQNRQPGNSTNAKSIEEVLLALKEDSTIITMVTSPDAYSDLAEKRSWEQTVSSENILFVDIADGQALYHLDSITNLICRTPAILPTSPTYCALPTDVYFLWDGSELSSANDVATMLKATRKIATSLHPLNFESGVNETNRVRISIIEFSDKYEYLVSLDNETSFEDFLNRVSSISISGRYGNESNLNLVLEEIDRAHSSLLHPRNITIVLFTASPVQHLNQNPNSSLMRLKEEGANIIAIGFGRHVNADELRNLSSSSGVSRSIATSREILDNDIGLLIANDICGAGELPTTTQPYTSTAPTPALPGASQAVSTPKSTIAVTYAPSCLKPMDIHIVVDSQLTADSQQKSQITDILYNALADIAIDDGTNYSRTSLQMAGAAITTKISLSKDGSDKRKLMSRFTPDSTNPAIEEMEDHSPFKLKRAITAGVHLFFEREPRLYGDYLKIFLLALRRLPDSEKHTDSTSGGVLKEVKDLKRRGYGFYLLYYNTTFEGVSHVRKQEWMKEFGGSSLLVTSNADDASLGEELADTLCFVFASTAAATQPMTSRYSSLSSTTAPTTSGIPHYCYDQPTRIVFFLETSVSIGRSQDNFDSMKRFIRDVIAPFTISPHAARVAVIQYGLQSHANGSFGFPLDQFHDRVSTLDAVSHLHQSSDQPYKPSTAPLLQQVIHQYFPNSTRRNKRAIIILSSTRDDVEPVQLSDVIDEAQSLNVHVIMLTAPVTYISPDVNFRTYLDYLNAWSGSALPDEDLISVPKGPTQLPQLAEEVTQLICGVGVVKPKSPDVKLVASTIQPQQFENATRIPGIPVPTEALPRCKLDLILIVDSSYSISPDDYIALKQFLSNRIRDFYVANDTTRISLIQYAGTSEIRWTLSDHIRDVNGMLSSIQSMKKIQGITNTYTTMINALDRFLNDEDSGRRENVPLIILLMTDGRAKDDYKREELMRKVAQASRKAAQTGTYLRIFTIGIGSVDRNELRKMATNDNHAFNVEQMSYLHRIQEELIESVCRVTAAPPRFTSPPQQPDCYRGMPPTDVLFVLDGSMSFAEPSPLIGYKKLLDEIVQVLNVGPNQTQIGVSFYDNAFHYTPPYGFSLDAHDDVTKLREAINQLEYPNKMKLRGAPALSDALSTGFNPSFGGRPNARKVAVVMVTSLDVPSFNGKVLTIDDVITAAIGSGVNVVVMLVPQFTDASYMKDDLIASLGSNLMSSNIIWVPGSFPDLKDHVTILEQLICAIEYRTTPSPGRAATSTQTSQVLTTVAPIQVCDQYDTDVVFMIDGSSQYVALTVGGNSPVKSFLLQLTRRFNISPNKTMFSVVEYDDSIYLRRPYFISAYQYDNDAANLGQEINKTVAPGIRSRNTGEALLDFASKYQDDEIPGVHKNNKTKKLVVFMDASEVSHLSSITRGLDALTSTDFHIYMIVVSSASSKSSYINGLNGDNLEDDEEYEGGYEEETEESEEEEGDNLNGINGHAEQNINGINGHTEQNINGINGHTEQNINGINGIQKASTGWKTSSYEIASDPDLSRLINTLKRYSPKMESVVIRGYSNLASVKFVQNFTELYLCAGTFVSPSKEFVPAATTTSSYPVGASPFPTGDVSFRPFYTEAAKPEDYTQTLEVVSGVSQKVIEGVTMTPHRIVTGRTPPPGTLRTMSRAPGYIPSDDFTQTPFSMECSAEDVIFVVDASLFSPPSVASHVQHFLQSLVSLIGSRGKSRFAMISYGNDFEVKFDLSAYLTVAQVMQGMDHIGHSGDNDEANVGNALKFAISSTSSLPNESGHVPRRQILLLMGRKSDDDLVESINEARNKSVDVITFMIGNLGIENSAQLSTIPYGDIDVQRVSDLDNLRYEVLELICTTPRTVTPSIPTPPPSMRITTCKVDLVFMIDNSLTSRLQSLRNLKKFLRIVAQNMVFGPDDFKAGIYLFGSETSVIWNGLSENKEEFLSIIQDNLQRSASSSPLSLTTALDGGERVLNKFGRESAGLKRMLVLLISRQPGHDQTSSSKLNQLTSENIIVASVVMDDATRVPKSVLTNRNAYINAYSSRYLHYFAAPVVYMIWDKVCVVSYRPWSGITPSVICEEDSNNVILLLDSSSDVESDAEERWSKDFVKNFAAHFVFSSNKTLFSVIPYDNNIRTSEDMYIVPDHYGSNPNVFNLAIDSLLLPSGSNRVIGDALRDFVAKYRTNQIPGLDSRTRNNTVIVLLDDEVANEMTSLRIGLDALLSSDVTAFLIIVKSSVSMQRNNVEQINGLNGHGDHVINGASHEKGSSQQRFLPPSFNLARLINALNTSYPSIRYIVAEEGYQELGQPSFLNQLTSIVCRGNYSIPIIPPTLKPPVYPEFSRPHVTGMQTSAYEGRTEMTSSTSPAERPDISRFATSTKPLHLLVTTQPLTGIVCPAQDLIFLIDSALLQSSFSTSFHIIHFLQDLLEVVGSKNQTRFGAFTYSDSAEMQLAFNSFLTNSQFKHALESLHHSGSTSAANAGSALSYVLNSTSSLPNESGHVPRRQILLLMGRKSDDDLVESINEARNKSVDVITFMIGNLGIENSAQLSTIPYGDIDVQRVSDLDNLRYEVLELICTVPKEDNFTTIFPTSLPESGCKVDVALLIDDDLLSDSGKLRPLRRYLGVIGNNLVFGNNYFRVGLYKLGAEVGPLSDGLVKTRPEFFRVLNHNLTVTPCSGTISMNQGLDEGMKVLEEFGRANEPNVKKMIVFVMRRRPTDYIATSTMNHLLQNNTVIVSVVMDEASKIPKNWLTNRLAYVNAYRPLLLNYYALPVVNMMWESVCEGVYQSILASTTTPGFTDTTTSVSPPATSISPPPSIDRCSYSNEIVVVMDVSGIGNSKLNQLKEFLRQILEKFHISKNLTRIALITYDATPTVVFRLDEGESLNSVLVKLQNLHPSNVGSLTKTGLALTEVVENVLSRDQDAREDADWTVFLITDGRSKDNLTVPLQRLSALSDSHTSKIRMVALGLQSADLGELERITSNKSITYVETYDALNSATPLQSVYHHLCSLQLTSAATARMVTLTASTIVSSTVCECRWTEFISRDRPTHSSIGDLEVWATQKSNYGGICWKGTKGFDVRCQSDSGTIQSNVECSRDTPFRCLHLEVPYNEGEWCYNYSISVKCCNDFCAEKPTTPPPAKTWPLCSELFDLIFVIDRSSSSSSYLHQVAAFLYDVTKRFKLTPQASRIAIVQYGATGPELLSGFTTNYTNIARLLQGIQPSVVGASDVGRALDLVFERLASSTRFVNANGDVINKAIIVVANSHSMGVVEGVVTALLDFEINVAAVGMNGASRNLLNRLTTYGSRGVYEPSNMQQLRTEVPQEIVENTLCKEIFDSSPYEYEYYYQEADVTEQPETTRGPGVPGVPGVTRGPGVPGVTRAPGQPGVTRGPGVPGITRSPEQPGVTRGPGVPGVTRSPEQPGVTRVPGVTRAPEQPGVTRGPGVPGIPGVTRIPEQPGVTRGPGQPGVTRGPGQPGVTRGPGEPEEPGVTRKQETVSTETTTTGGSREPTCAYFNDTSEESMILKVREVVYPNPHDACTYFECKPDGVLSLRNKKLRCNESKKPSCENGFEPKLYYDGNCNCQWECQCYCNVGEDSSYHTFDGSLFFFPAAPGCEYVFSQSSQELHLDSNYRVQLTYGLCNSTNQTEMTSCVVNVAVVMGNNTYELTNNLEPTLNGYPLSLPYRNDDAHDELVAIGDMTLVLTSSDIGLKVKYTPFHHSVCVSLPAYLWDSRTEGLCGNCNRRKVDDMMMRSKSLSQNLHFGYNWTTSDNVEECSKPPASLPVCFQEPDPICNVIMEDDVFSKCRAVVGFERYFNACKMNTCSNVSNACESISIFAEACRYAGVCVEWRSSSICPVSCPDGHVFDSCRQPPFDKMCDERFTKDAADAVTFYEGCFLDCGEYGVVEDGKCVSNLTCTMCFNENTNRFVEAGTAWTHTSNVCSVCTCDVVTLEIQCINRSCSHIPLPPKCGSCESPRIQAGSDPCCPEYSCECDFSNCSAVRPNSCPHGAVERRNTNSSDCQPVYSCQCLPQLCRPANLTCHPPHELARRPTSCCDEYYCTCPSCPSSDIGSCRFGSVKRYRTDACNCTTEWCEPLSVCVFTYKKKHMMKTLHEIWKHPRFPCRQCKCKHHWKKGVMSYRYTCRNISSECLPCMTGYRPEPVDGACCPRCVKDKCFIEDGSSTIYRDVGETWPLTDNMCLNATCDRVDGVPVIQEHRYDCPPAVAQLCDFGFTTSCVEIDCCIKCTCEPNAVCLLNNTKLQRPGSSWMTDSCTRCQCGDEIGVDGFHVKECTATECPDCPAGEKRVASSDNPCCGSCVAAQCNITIPGSNLTQVIQNGETFRLRCTSYHCTETPEGQVVVVPTTQSCRTTNATECSMNGGVVVFDEFGCCSECQLPLGGCQAIRATPKVYTIKGCTTDESIELSYCEGQCTSGSHYHDVTGGFVRYCGCCHATEYYNQSFPATCDDGIQTQLQFRIITSCTCERKDCGSWTRDPEFDSKPVSNQNDNRTSVMATWMSGDRFQVRVIDANNLPPDGSDDTFDSVTSVLSRLGFENPNVKVVRVDNPGSNPTDAFTRGIDAAFSDTDKHINENNPATDASVEFGSPEDDNSTYDLGDSYGYDGEEEE